MLEVKQLSRLTAAYCVVSFRYKGMFDHTKPEGGQP